MYRPRIIPVLLLKDQGLVKTIRFSKPKYIGDPINAVRIFNKLKTDELVFLDIQASEKSRPISLDFVKKVAGEANMPFAVGGGIRSLETIRAILEAGAEKVIIGSYALENPDFILEASNQFGASTVCVCVDVKKPLLSRSDRVYVLNGRTKSKYGPLEFAKLLVGLGVGELIIQSIDNDGVMEGYDVSLINEISNAVPVPVIGLGGAGSIAHLEELAQSSVINGLAAGSIFVYNDRNRGVLINYPDSAKKDRFRAIFYQAV